MHALLNRLRDRMSAREWTRAPDRDARCDAASMNDALASHREQIERDAMEWSYRMMAGEAGQEPAGTEPLGALLEELAPQQVVLLRAWFQLELTCSEIAAAQNVSLDDARARVQEVLQRLSEAAFDAKPRRPHS